MQHYYTLDTDIQAIANLNKIVTHFQQNLKGRHGGEKALLALLLEFVFKHN